MRPLKMKIQNLVPESIKNMTKCIRMLIIDCNIIIIIIIIIIMCL